MATLCHSKLPSQSTPELSSKLSYINVPLASFLPFVAPYLYMEPLYIDLLNCRSLRYVSVLGSIGHQTILQ